MATVDDVKGLLDQVVPAGVKAGETGGFVVGVWHAGEQWDFAFGSANLNTAAPMTPDTGWLLGSVSKVLTTTALLRFVERGEVDLDEKVVTYLPDLRIGKNGAEQALTVRSLVNHTNGIDADTYMPTREFGPRAVEEYVSGLVDIDVLFDVEELLSYSNAGFVLAGRILEVITGKPYNDILQQEIFDPIGMTSSSTSPDQAILRRTAVGTHVDGKGAAAATEMFRLPVSGAPAGSTQIVTTGDLLAFARTHLNGGVAPNGMRVLSADLVAAMQTPSFELVIADFPVRVGLGWFLGDLGGATTLGHGGGSPGGLSYLSVLPEHDLAVAAFGTGEAAPLSAGVAPLIAATVVGLTASSNFQPDLTPGDLTPYAGSYRQFQQRLDVTTDGDVLVLNESFEPWDDEHLRFLSGYIGPFAAGTNTKSDPKRLTSVGDGVFVGADANGNASSSGSGLAGVVSFHLTDGDGRARYLFQGARMARRID